MSKDWFKGICGCTHNVPWCIITACFPCVTSYTVGNKIGKKNLAVVSAIASTLYMVSGIISSACSENSEKLKVMQTDPELAETMEADGMFYGAVFFAFIHLLGIIAFIVIVAKMRASVRETYDVSGDSTADCVLSCFCSECVLCQMYNQVDYEMTQGGANLCGDDRNVNIQRV